MAHLLAGANIDRGVGVRVTADVEDKAASGGCDALACSALTFLGLRRSKKAEFMKIMLRSRIFDD